MPPLPTAKLAPEETLACLRLIRSDNVGPVTFRELVNHFGGARPALDALPHLAKRGGRGKQFKICPAAEAEAELEAAERAGSRPVFTIEPGYPALLAACDVPPPMLYIKGRDDLLNKPGVAIVGSRDCSAAGAKLAQMFAHDIAGAGFVIVSGLARGIDRVAHQTALDRGTVAVLAGGIDNIYPPENERLYHDIASRGCLVSELPPGFKPRSQDFPRRNRIISGLSLGVVIVEAAARSGTSVTARFAGEQGREVFAVPGHPLDPRAEGTNKLLKDGATIATSAEDVLEVLRPQLATAGLSERSFPAALDAPMAELDTGQPTEPSQPALEQVLLALGPAPVDIDTLARVTGLPLRTVRIALVELDLAGSLSRPGPGLVARR